MYMFKIVFSVVCYIKHSTITKFTGYRGHSQEGGNVYILQKDEYLKKNVEKRKTTDKCPQGAEHFDKLMV